jgi:hypothetical protein
VRRLAFLIVVVGCGEDTTAITDAATKIDADVDVDAEPPGPCPAGMAHVDTFCIDRYEGALEEQTSNGTWTAASPYQTIGTRTVRAVPANGITPQGYISGTEAAKASASARRPNGSPRVADRRTPSIHTARHTSMARATMRTAVTRSSSTSAPRTACSIRST